MLKCFIDSVEFDLWHPSAILFHIIQAVLLVFVSLLFNYVANYSVCIVFKPFRTFQKFEFSCIKFKAVFILLAHMCPFFPQNPIACIRASDIHVFKNIDLSLLLNVIIEINDIRFCLKQKFYLSGGSITEVAVRKCHQQLDEIMIFFIHTIRQSEK